MLARTQGRHGPGHTAARTALAELEALATTLTRSSLEVRFQRLIQRAGLSKPQANVRIENHAVDAAWPDAKLIIELDGWKYHSSKQAFQVDRERDVRLTSKGWTVLRFTHQDVTTRPAWVADTIRTLLTAR